MTKTCAGCSANLRKEYLVCHNCNDSYDLLCANLTQNKFSLMSKDNKNTWICHACRCKIPKHDNTNTPVRISTSKPSNTSSAPPGSDHSNVTMRYKSRQGVPDNQISGSSSQNTSLWDSQLEDKHVSTMNNLSMEEIRGIVRDEFNIAFSHFETNLLKNMEIKNNELIERVEQLTTSLNFFETKYEEIRADVQTKNELLKKLEHENKELKSSFADFSARLAQMEHHSRASNIEIHCIPEHKSENLVTVIKQIANVTEYKLSETDIHLCTRISKMDKNSSKPRSVLVKFASPRVRDGFLASTMVFNKKQKDKDKKLNSSHIGMSGEQKPIYVMEHLSPAMKSLHAATRVRAKEMGYRYV